jgi:FAD/FMN-containing dehydrogenase
MIADRATFERRLADAVGDANVLTAAADVEPFVVDWRGRYRGSARAVVRPATTAEVASVVRACADASVPIVPQGGNTGLCGGATPAADGGAIVLSLARMRRVRALDDANATITVEAGIPLAAVHEAAASAGLHFPLSLAAEGTATIGGNLSTNAGGTAVLRFGNARELVLGIEVVLADGRVLDGLRGLRKDNTGYDLKQLFIGAEGTLGIVTAAVLKLFPAPRTSATAWVAVDSPDAAVSLLRALRDALSDRLTGFELISDVALGFVARNFPKLRNPLPGHGWYVLVQADDTGAASPLGEALEAALADAVERGAARDASIAQTGDQAAAMWALRENISDGQKAEGPNIKHDISLPVSAIPEYLDAAQSALSAAFPGVRFVVFGHLGDGNLHYNLAAPDGVEAAGFMANAERANRIVHDLVAARGGSISAEHGIGQLKRDELGRYKSEVELDVMRAVKRALDPRGLMNPGKVLA